MIPERVEELYRQYALLQASIAVFEKIMGRAITVDENIYCELERTKIRLELRSLGFDVMPVDDEKNQGKKTS